MTDADSELLARYAGQQAEDAFAEIVRRHLGLVYSAALRQVRSPQLAEEVAQSAFIKLAQQAARLKPDTILTAWLYQVTRHAAIDVVRREASRQLREQIATEMNAMNATAADWTHIEPLLDEAMHALDDTDRTAVLLRYFENKSLREVGATLGTSENAAQKRLGRAVERLREFFTKRGVTAGASGLVVVISANAVQAAPAELAVSISSAAALAGTAFHTATAIAATKTIGISAVQKIVMVAAFASTVGIAIFEAHQSSRLRDQFGILQRQQTPLSEQFQQLRRERDDATNRVAILAEAVSRAESESSALPRLRGEVMRLRDDSVELARLKADLLRHQLGAENQRVQVSNQTAQENSLPANVCMKNLRRIEQAIALYTLENRKRDGEMEVSAKQILPYLGSNELPQCPSGGTYTLGQTKSRDGHGPSCSMAGHTPQW